MRSLLDGHHTRECVERVIECGLPFCSSRIPWSLRMKHEELTQHHFRQMFAHFETALEAIATENSEQTNKLAAALNSIVSCLEAPSPLPNCLDKARTALAEYKQVCDSKKGSSSSSFLRKKLQPPSPTMPSTAHSTSMATTAAATTGTREPIPATVPLVAAPTESSSSASVSSPGTNGSMDTKHDSKGIASSETTLASRVALLLHQTTGTNPPSMPAAPTLPFYQTQPQIAVPVPAPSSVSQSATPPNNAATATSSSSSSSGGGSADSKSNSDRDGDFEIILCGGVHAITTTDRRAQPHVQGYKNGSWVTLADMPTARGWCSAARHENKIYVTGGSIVGGSRLPTVEVYDVLSNKWSTSTPLLKARDEHLTLVCDGRVYVVGGVPTGTSHALTTMEVYDEKNNAWNTSFAAMNRGRGYAAGVVWNNRIYVFGGKPSLGVSRALQSAEMYDPKENKWFDVKMPPSARSAHRAIVIDDKIILLGGQVSSADGKTVTAVESAEEYDPKTDSWTPLDQVACWRLPLPCANFAVHFDEKTRDIIIAGGWPIARSGAAFRRNGKTGNWSVLPQLPYPNYEAGFV